MRNVILLLLSLFPNCLKPSLYRLFGYTIGKGTKIGFFSIINGAKKVNIGKHCNIGHFTVIQGKDIVIGDNSEVSAFTIVNVPKLSIGCDTKIGSCVIIRAGHVSMHSELIVDDLVHIFPFVLIDCSRKVHIMDEAGIGPKCNIYTHSSYKSVLEGYPVTYGDVQIGKRVELTYSVFVAPGVSIGDDAICAYGAYVNKDIPAGVLAAGMPAVIKRTQDQMRSEVSSLDAKRILEGIIQEFTGSTSLGNSNASTHIELCVEQDVNVNKSGVIYLLCDSQVTECSAKNYALFDISNKQCANHGFNNSQFSGFRKYLSRYGIRFITREDI